MRAACRLTDAAQDGSLINFTPCTVVEVNGLPLAVLSSQAGGLVARSGSARVVAGPDKLPVVGVGDLMEGFNQLDMPEATKMVEGSPNVFIGG